MGKCRQHLTALHQLTRFAQVQCVLAGGSVMLTLGFCPLVVVVMPASDGARFLRLWFQPVLVAWALWSTGGWRWLRDQLRS